ncbi:UNVERIFIED_CONTAM: hypothetical protein FKN15_068412 [Acipenser sinensis]
MLVNMLSTTQRPAGNDNCKSPSKIMGSLGGTTPPHLLFTGLWHKYGDLFGLYLGPHYTAVINSFKHTKEILLRKVNTDTRLYSKLTNVFFNSDEETRGSG